MRFVLPSEGFNLASLSELYYKLRAGSVTACQKNIFFPLGSYYYTKVESDENGWSARNIFNKIDISKCSNPDERQETWANTVDRMRIIKERTLLASVKVMDRRAYIIQSSRFDWRQTMREGINANVLFV